MASYIGRRKFLATLIGGAAAWPLAARAQQPLVGFLSSASPDTFAPFAAAFRAGLSEAGYFEGRNVTIEYRWAQDQSDRLPALAADLVRHQVAVMFASGGSPSVRAAQAATASIPIVFTSGLDPVKLGLVASLNRPGGNMTGVTFFTGSLVTKRLELLHELVPKATVIAALIDPNYPEVEDQSTDREKAAGALHKQILVVEAGGEDEFDAAFARIAQAGAGALLVGAGAFFVSQRRQLVALARHRAVPALYTVREFAAAGGLISYGASAAAAYHLAGGYVGRVLKGERPADLPVQQSTKIDLVINLKTAKALGLDVPDKLLALADEVIE
jgi:putative ABC transport system substrate-binding protein